MMANAAMAESIWISLVSNLVRRISRHYVAACAGTIAAICMVFAGSLATAASPLYCVLVPHFKDDYWLSVGFGLEQEAERQGVDLLFFEAGGYEARAAQIGQLDACVASGADAILIGAVTSDHPDLMTAIARVAETVPVFGLVNELHADALSGRIGVDWQDMGHAIGEHLRQLHPKGSPPKTAVFLTGPAEAGWTGPLEAGLRDGLAGSSVNILEVFEADTGIRPQLALAELALERHPDADYMIGSAPAIEAAIGLLAARTDADKPTLLATYVSHTIIRGLMNGSILAASFDDPILQAQMAIRQVAALRVSADQRLAPEIVLLTRDDASLGAVRMSPADYFPAVQ
jgi:protein TorT